MYTELREQVMKRVRTRIIICAVILVLILVVFGDGFVKLADGPKDLYSLTEDELQGAYVEGDVDFILDAFAEYTEESNGIEKTIEQYFIIPVVDDEYFIGMGVLSKELDTANQICDETWECLMGSRSEPPSSMQVKGTISKMNDELRGFYYEWFEEAGILEDTTMAELEEYAPAYVLKPGRVGYFEVFYIYFAMAACGVLMILIIYFLMRGLSGSYLSEINELMNNPGSSDGLDDIQTDYENAATIESAKVGRCYTVYFMGCKVKVVKNSEILWAYLKRVTHRTNGIKTNVTYSLILRTRTRAEYTIGMKKEVSVNEALKQYSISNPHIILGYSDDLKKCYQKDFNSFINMSLQQEEKAKQAAEKQESAGSVDHEYNMGGNDHENNMGGNAKVILRDRGSNPIPVIQSLRKILDCGLKEAKDLVDNVPSVLKENISVEEAQAIKSLLEGLGAAVEIEETSQVGI